MQNYNHMNRTITDVMTQYYLPQLRDATGILVIRSLTEDFSLTLSALCALDLTKQVPEALRGTAKLLLNCRIVHTVLREEPLTQKSSKAFTRSLRYLLVKVDKLDVRGDIARYVTKLVPSIVAVVTPQGLKEYCKSIKFLSDKSLYPGVDALYRQIDDKCELILFSSHRDLSVENLKSSLENLKVVKELRPEGKYPDFISISTQLVYAYVKTGETQREDVKEIFQLVSAIGIECPELLLLMEKLELTIPDKPKVTEQIIVTREQDVEKDRRALYANTSGDVNVSIHRARLRLGNAPDLVVVKEYSSTNGDKLSAILEKEAGLLKRFSGKKPCFLSYYGSYSTRDRDNSHLIGIVMEFCSDSLISDISQRANSKTDYTELELAFLTWTLLEGFHFMHQHNVYHMDIKPHNIFISVDGTPKIGDFNVSQELGSTLGTMKPDERVIQGTDGYLAFELQQFHDEKVRGIVQGDPFYHPGKADVYSLGLTFLQMYLLTPITGYNKAENQTALQGQIQSIQYSWLRTLLNNMLHPDSNSRKTMVNLLNSMQTMRSLQNAPTLQDNS